MRPGWMGQLDGVGGLRSADQPQLQGRDSAKVGITADHHGFRSKLQAASCLEGIGCAQSMQGSHEGGLLKNRSREFDPNQVWLGKNGIAVVRKVFGIILMAIAVRLFTANIGSLIS